MSGLQEFDHVALNLTEVWKHFGGVAALKGVSLTVAQGEVHALLGENGAGKSTLMGVTAGSLQPDGGVVEVFGAIVEDLNPLRSQDQGISIVYQHPALAPDLTVLENLAISLPAKLAHLNATAKSRIMQQLVELGLDVSLNTRVSDLDVVEQQLLEIAKALLAQPRILILDEPTAALGARETDMLFGRIRELAASGVAVVYITHRLSEVRQICDSVTILRDGEACGTFAVSSVSDQEILRLIVGRDLAHEFPPKHHGERNPPALTTRGLTGDGFFDVDFEVPAGEIVGVAGIIGNGQTQFLRAVAGMTPSHGSLAINGEAKKIRNSSSALDEGIVYLSADRLREGLMTTLSVRENTVVSNLSHFSKKGIIHSQAEEAAVLEKGSSLALKASSIDVNVKSLSGGNQQKVLFMRSLLAKNLKVLLADEPTQGVDVGARAEIYGILRDIANQGVAVVIVSSDNRELAGVCDRVATFSSGHKVSELDGDNVTAAKITESIVTATKTNHSAELVHQKASWIKTFGRSDYGAPVILLVMTVLISMLTAYHSPRFLSAFNLNGLFLLVAGLSFVAFGETFVILTGGIDLSAGPVVGLSAVIGSVFEIDAKNHQELIFGFIIMLAAGAAIGFVNGILVLSKAFTPVAATLVTYVGIQGISLAIRPFQAGYISYSVINAIQAGILNVPYAFLICLFGAIALDIGLRRAKWGRRLRAVGSDPESAFRLGIKTNFTIIRAYMMCSLCAVLGGVMLMASIGVGDATQGINFTLAGITAVILGGTSVFGGRGSFMGVFIGAMLLEILLNITVFLNLSQAYQYWFQGLLIFFAVGIYTTARNRRARPKLLTQVV